MTIPHATWTMTPVHPDHPDAARLHGYREIPAYSHDRYAEHWFERLLRPGVDEDARAR